MPERLMTLKEVCGVLKISRATFYRIRDELVASGLQPVTINSYCHFREASVDRLIAEAAKSGRPIAKSKGVQTDEPINRIAS